MENQTQTKTETPQKQEEQKKPEKVEEVKSQTVPLPKLKEKVSVANEREYTIPLRCEWKKVPRYKRANKAIKAIKEFLVRHMKIRDRELKKVKVDKYLNEAVWFRGIKKPPQKIKVKVVKEGDIVRAELSEMPTKLKFKKLREEKRERRGAEVAKKKKSLMEKVKEGKQKTPEEKQTQEEKTEEKEKVKSVEESGKQIEKAAAKQVKHQAAPKEKQQKHQIRKTLAK